jgi:hypothetical protein
LKFFILAKKTKPVFFLNTTKQTKEGEKKIRVQIVLKKVIKIIYLTISLSLSLCLSKTDKNVFFSEHVLHPLRRSRFV